MAAMYSEGKEAAKLRSGRGGTVSIDPEWGSRWVKADGSHSSRETFSKAVIVGRSRDLGGASSYSVGRVGDISRSVRAERPPDDSARSSREVWQR